jgi:hypothetical protein
MNASIISSIVLFKTYAKICSNSYLNMDHEKIRQLSIISIFMMSLVELSLFASFFGTICTKSNTLHTHYLMKLDMSDEVYIFLPPISYINIYAIVVVQIVHWVCKNRQYRKVNILTETNSGTPPVNSVNFQTVGHSESFELKINDLREYPGGTQVEEDHLCVL